MIQSQVLDAMWDFSDFVNKHKRQGEDGSFLTANDVDRGHILRDLSVTRGLSLRGWSVHDVFLFAVRTYPERLLYSCAMADVGSSYLHELHTLWTPTVVDWVCFLRRFCVLGSFRLFVMVLRMNHCQDQDLPRLGKALIFDLPRITLRQLWPPEYPPLAEEDRKRLAGDESFEPEPFGDDLLESVAASFVFRPHDPSCNRQQADNILALTGPLGSKCVGIMCRRLFFFLARDMSCDCDVVKENLKSERKPECMCERNFERDLRKEHARALCFSILLKMDLWSNEEKQEFLTEACAFRFSSFMYKELSKALLDFVNPDDIPDNPRARPYTKEEVKESYHTNHSVVTHAGCAEVCGPF
jgi:hypothetical protein